MPIDRNGGQYITANPQQPTQSSAPGIWDIDEQGSAQAAGRWPLPPNVVQRSLRFNSADSAYLIRTVGSGNRQTFTWSGWLKTGKVYTSTEYFFSARQAASDNFGLAFQNNSVLQVDGAVSSAGFQLTTTQVFRDPSAWYHIVMAVDTTLASGRIKLYVNGTQITAFSTETYPAQNSLLAINLSSAVHNISGYNSASNFWNGYMAEVNFVDGQALTPSSFGQTDAQTGQWIPRVYSGSYGTNGFRLQFLDNSGTTATTLGKDTSGLGNNWTPNNFSVAAGSGNDSLRDVPMNYYSPDNGLGGEVIGNYATLNPLRVTTATLTNGNLETSTGNTATKVLATLGMSSGKWYWEFSFTNIAGDGACGIATGNSSSTAHVGNDADSWSYRADGLKGNNSVVTAYGATWTTNDIIGVSFDADAGSLSFYKNGVSQGVAFTGLTSGPYFPAFGDNASGASSTLWTNFGQRPFAYTAPSGFKALCTQNLSAPRIGNVAVAQANDYFNATLYTGTGSSLSVTGTGFQPDLVWIKSRSAASSHALYDAVRGVQKQLISNSTADESTQTTGLTAFGSDGFTIGSLAQINTNAATYVAWQWNAGGSTVTNTQGTLSTQLRASPTAGFSIATFTGAAGTKTFGHGLGVAPSFIITKYRIESGLGAGPWYTYHVSLGNTQYVSLNSTGAATTSVSTWNNTTPTADLVTLGSSYASTSDTFVAYCFAAVPGFSAFGSYTGNGSADGPFVYLGFRPKWILVKNSSFSPTNWILQDTSRSPYNVSGNLLLPDSSSAEILNSSSDYIDILSSGFKVRNSGDSYNRSSSTIIYAAFAEIPFQFANAR